MVNATGVLTELDAPGHFSQVWSKKKFSQAGTIFNNKNLSTGLKNLFPQTLEFFGFEGPPTDYNVIYIDEDSAIE